jgi:ATP/maltotriose-dependent transcriptional regulator MalT
VTSDAEPQADLERARAAVARRSWLEAHEAFARVDAGSPLDAEDLELHALTALMLARDDNAVAILERAHHARLEHGDHVPAATDAIWIGLNLAYRGAVGPASGWLGRAQRLLDKEAADCAQRGYLLLPTVFRLEAGGEYADAAATAAEAAAIGGRFGDRDLFALGLHAQGHCLVLTGDVAEGLALLDEAMVAVTTGDLSPFVMGIVYCGVILACESVFEVGRAREWTGALARWAEEQQDLVAFTGRCLVHRAQILQLSGSWPDALEEARVAGDRLAEANDEVAGVARYREAELLRLTGDFEAAEQAYRGASRLGWEPQPGLAQLRLAQGRAEAALTAIRRAGAELHEPLKRAAILPAHVEIALAEGELEEARAACAELDELATAYESTMLAAMAAYSRGSVALAHGEPRAALGELREAQRLWLELQAPYEVARTRALLARACSALADEESAALELEAAREIFERLGAAPDLERLAPTVTEPQHGLSGREVEVLRLVARGKSNREIAAELVISEHTVARHLQNIYTKLRLPSRAAATAFAFERDLV